MMVSAGGDDVVRPTKKISSNCSEGGVNAIADSGGGSTRLISQAVTWQEVGSADLQTQAVPPAVATIRDRGARLRANRCSIET